MRLIVYQVPPQKTTLEHTQKYKNPLELPKNLSILPLEGTESLSQTNSTQQLQTRLITKQILKVYLDNDTNTKWIDHASAFAHGLTKVRAIMLDTPKYYPITDGKIAELISTKQYEIEIVTLPPKKKQDINLYYNKDNTYYIEIGAAYSLGRVDAETFFKTEGLYGPLKEEELKMIKESFNIISRPMEEETKSSARK